MSTTQPTTTAAPISAPVIRKASDPVEVNSVRVLIYGPPGVGKTAFSFTAPDALLIDSDGGIRRLDPKLRGDNVPVKSWADIVGVLSLDLSSYKTLIIDTAGRALDYLASDIIATNPAMGYMGALTQKGFGVLKSRFSSFCSTAAILGKNLVFVAHDKETRTDDGLAVSRPDIIGGSLANIMREMDLVGYMSTDVNGVRSVSFDSTDKHYGKNTAELEPRLLTDTIKLSDIFERFRAREQKRAETFIEYEKLLSIIKEKVNSITTPELADQISKELAELTPIWDSKLHARTLLLEKVKSLWLSYDKASGKFIVSTPVANDSKSNEAVLKPTQNDQKPEQNDQKAAETVTNQPESEPNQAQSDQEAAAPIVQLTDVSMADPGPIHSFTARLNALEAQINLRQELIKAKGAKKADIQRLNSEIADLSAQFDTIIEQQNAG
jgi:hypothetical protein